MRAFLKKEWLEAVRTGRFWLLLLIFILMGIMNPAMAKLTPWMMEIMSDSLADAGFMLTAVTIDAMTSWTQFYKNIPLGFVIFVLLNSGSFTAEYQKGTLIPVVTKGLARRKIAAAKALQLEALWTVLYVLCFCITYGYNEYFWGNDIVQSPLLGAICFWLFGIWTLALMVLFSTVSRNNIQVLLGTGAAAFGVYALGLFPKLSPLLPAKLMDGMALLNGAAEPTDYMAAIAAAGGTAMLAIGLGAVCFERKEL
ncbi:MAG: ABC transporter permease subunit [Eubacteriales bacterium]|nr:ABC transporter permease subunit [Eubacteriales bacterium]